MDELRFRATASADRLAIGNLQARLYRGIASGSTEIPLNQTAAGRIELRWNGVQLAALVGDLIQQDLTAGASNGQVTATLPAGKLADLSAWQARGTAAIGNFAVRGMQVQRVRGEFRLQDQAIVVPTFDAALPHGGVAAAVRVNLASSPPIVAANFVARDLDFSDLGDQIPVELRPIGGRLTMSGSARARWPRIASTCAAPPSCSSYSFAAP